MTVVQQVHSKLSTSQSQITLGVKCFGYVDPEGTFCLVESRGNIVFFPGASLGEVLDHPKVNGFADYNRGDNVVFTNTQEGMNYYLDQDTVFQNQHYTKGITIDEDGKVIMDGVAYEVRWVNHVRGGRGGTGVRMSFGAICIGSIVLGGNYASDMSYKDKYEPYYPPPPGEYTISKIGVNVVGILGKSRMWLVSGTEEMPYGATEWSDTIYDAQISGFISSERVGYFSGYSIHTYGYTNTYGHRRKLDNDHDHIWQLDQTLFMNYTLKLMQYRGSFNWPLANSWTISSASDILAYRIDKLNTDLPVVSHPEPRAGSGVYWGKRYYTFMNNPVSGWSCYGFGSEHILTVCQDWCIYVYGCRDYYNRQYTMVSSFAVGSNSWTDPFRNPYLGSSVEYPHSEITSISLGLIAIANDYCVNIYQLPCKEASYQIEVDQQICAIAIYNKRIVIATRDWIEVHKLDDNGGSLKLITINVSVKDVAIHENVVAWTGDEGTKVLLNNERLAISVDTKPGRYVKARKYRVLVSSLYTNEVDLYEVTR